MRWGLLWLGVTTASLAAAVCDGAEKQGKVMTYHVARLTQAPTLDAQWDKTPWNKIPAETIGRYMGAKPEHFPQTQVKVAYDSAALYVIFRVADRYVRAVTTAPQGPVCKDSCVEFFFTPGGDVTQGYFNLEVNCGGTPLLYHQKERGKEAVALPADDYRQITIAHSLPKVVEPEIAAPTTWTVEYRLPFAILKKYCPVAMPAPGVTWRANFYKCGDNTSHPHWLTWAPVARPQPDFHRPECFGILRFQ